jgi:catechol 2,3-dioxygenase-like lactoylglutathione lyase family enzyme
MPHRRLAGSGSKVLARHRRPRRRRPGHGCLVRSRAGQPGEPVHRAGSVSMAELVLRSVTGTRNPQLPDNDPVCTTLRCRTGADWREDDAMPQPQGTELEEIWARRERLRECYLRPVADRPTTTAAGVHHVALICRDVEETIRFYQDFLGFPLVELVEMARPVRPGRPGVPWGRIGGRRQPVLPRPQRRRPGAVPRGAGPLQRRVPAPLTPWGHAAQFRRRVPGASLTARPRGTRSV